MNIKEMETKIEKLDKLMKPYIDKKHYGNVYGTYNLQKKHWQDKIEGIQQGIKKAEQLDNEFIKLLKEQIARSDWWTRLEVKLVIDTLLAEKKKKLTALNGGAK